MDVVGATPEGHVAMELSYLFEAAERVLVLQRTDLSVYVNAVVLLDEPRRSGVIEKMKGGNV